MDPREALDAEDLLHERYAGGGERSALLEAYYRVKPLIPRRAQLALRRSYAPRQARRESPACPAEDVLVRRMHQHWRAELDASGAERMPILGLWPGGHASAAVVTHDVEGPEGIARLDEVLALEARHEIVSSWNFCGDWYEIPAGTFDRVRSAGCEVG